MLYAASSPANESYHIISGTVQFIQACTEGYGGSEVHPALNEIHRGLGRMLSSIEIGHRYRTLGKDKRHLRPLPSHKDILEDGIDVCKALLRLGRAQFRPLHVLF